jgi:hypothetical protein
MGGYYSGLDKFWIKRIFIFRKETTSSEAFIVIFLFVFDVIIVVQRQRLMDGFVCRWKRMGGGIVRVNNRTVYNYQLRIGRNSKNLFSLSLTKR